MREIVLGTAGHVDHGKTSLVQALTGIDTDRLKEEKKRGITIELGFAYLDLPCGHRLGIVDVPGHERFVKNMVAGASGVDLVAFVVAADEGIMPQTTEHFEICQLLGVKNGFIVITKKDMVEPDWLELVIDEVRTYFADSFLADAPLFPVSSITGEGLPELKSALDDFVGKWQFTEAHGPFRLGVDRIFNMKGFGTVVTGTSVSGRIGVGDDVIIYPRDVSGKIRGIQVHGQSVDQVEAGSRTAINIQGLEKEMLQRGDFLATPDCLDPSYILDADFLYLSINEKKLKNRTRVRVHLGTAEIMGRIVLLEDEELMPGHTANAQIFLEEPIGCWPGDHYVVRSYSPVYTIGGGVIFNGTAHKRKRFQPEIKNSFDIYRHNEPEDLVLLHVRESGWQGIKQADLAIKVGIFGRKLQKLLQRPISARQIVLIDTDQQLMVAGETYEQVTDLIKEALKLYHKENPLKHGLAREELRNRAHIALGPKLFQAGLQQLLRKDVAVLEGVIRLAEHQVSLRADEKQLRQDIEDFFNAAGLATPTIKEVLAKFADAPADLVKQVVSLLVKDAILTKVTADLYFFTRSLDELKAQLIAFLQEEGEIDAPRFKDMTGLTRKFSIPLLEYFDSIKLTLRVGDCRILRKKR